MSGDFAIVLPEIVMAIGAMALLMFGAYGGEDRKASLILWISAGLMGALAFWIGFGDASSHDAFGGSFSNAGYARFAKILILLSAAWMLVLGERFLDRYGMLKFEYPILILLAVTGMMVMVSANDLIVLYMGLELQSLALYVVAAFNRDIEPLETTAAVVVLDAVINPNNA